MNIKPQPQPSDATSVTVATPKQIAVKPAPVMVAAKPKYKMPEHQDPATVDRGPGIIAKVKDRWNTSMNLSPSEQKYVNTKDSLSKSYLKSRAAHGVSLMAEKATDDILGEGNSLKKPISGVTKTIATDADGKYSRYIDMTNSNAVGAKYRSAPGGIREFITNKRRYTSGNTGNGMYTYEKKK